jgi:hypothetical protein
LCAIGWLALRSPTPAWNVTRDGIAARVAEGEWVETGPAGAASIEIGKIGVVRVEPGSRVRIVTASPTEHRLELAEGEIEAQINAPPRLFFVNTPATTAIDLGCAYRMRCDKAGNGYLRVTSGWVELGRDNGVSLVPAGARASIRAKQGAGTPYFEDAPAELRAAIEQFDQGERGLEAILQSARVRDTLTLWHLLAQVQDAERERVYDRIAALTPVPSGVTREKALALDEDTLRRWREELAWSW